MAVNSIVTKLGDGTSTDFTFSFTGGYMSQADVKVRVGAEVDGAGNPVYRSRTFLNPGTIRVGGAVPLNGQKVVISRQTPIQTPINDFAGGTVLDDVSLDNGFQQVVNAAQELQDGLADAISAKESARAAAADALLAGTAKTAAEAARDTTIAYRDQAGVSAAAAAVSATAAQGSKNAAASSETNAQGSATAAAASATAAAASRTAADAAKTAAQSAQGVASTHAGTAATKATEAQNSANAASASATGAAASAVTAQNWANIATDAVQSAYGLVNRERQTVTTVTERTGQSYGPMSEELQYTPERNDTTFNATFTVGVWTQGEGGADTGAGDMQLYYWTGSEWASIGHGWTIGLNSIDNAGGTGNRSNQVIVLPIGLTQSHVHGGQLRFKVYGKTNGSNRRIRTERVIMDITEEKY